MSDSFKLYPVLDEKLIGEAGVTISPVSCFYSNLDDEFQLQVEAQGDSLSECSALVTDPKCDWHVEQHDIIIRRTVSAVSFDSWFGKNGIVPETAVIGLALQWVCSKAGRRGVQPFAEIHKGNKEVCFEPELRFERSSLRDSILIQTVVYLKEPGIKTEGEEYLCAQTGTVLGVLDKCELLLEGNGSLFPIATINAPDKPLWSVYYDDTADPMTDHFDKDHVEIRLNKAHPCYDQLNIESSLKESPLFLEVISSALLIIVESAKEAMGADWDSVLGSQNQFEHGTIAEAMNYFIVKLGWDTSSPSGLAQSIHAYFDANLKGGTL